MKTYIPSLTIAAVAAALVIGSAVSAPAQSTNTPAPKKEAAAKKDATAKTPAQKQKSVVEKPKNTSIPFKGTIGAVDRTAMTIKVGERTFVVTSTTRILKAGKPATFSDATVGEECAGSYKKVADDKLEVLSLRIGPKPEGAAAPADPADSKPKEKAAK